MPNRHTSLEDQQEMSSMDRILADLQMASTYIDPAPSPVSANFPAVHASLDSNVDTELPETTTETRHIHLPMDSSEPVADSLQSNLGELDIVYLMSLRERLLKMAMFAGLNTECGRWLQELKKLHWNLLHKETYVSVANETVAVQDPLHDPLEADLASFSTTTSSSSSASARATSSGSFNFNAGVTEEGVGHVCKEAGWTFAFLAVTITAALLGPLLRDPYSSPFAAYIIPILGASFFSSIAATLLFLLLPTMSLSLACPLAMFFLFLLALVILVVSPTSLFLAVLTMIVAVAIGLWGARTIRYLRLSLPLFSLATSIIKHHLALIPIALVSSYVVSLYSHHIFSSILHIIAHIEADPKDPYSHTISLDIRPNAATILGLPVLFFGWVWFCEVVRYVLQCVVHGIIAFHYHLTPPHVHDNANALMQALEGSDAPTQSTTQSTTQSVNAVRISPENPSTDAVHTIFDYLSLAYPPLTPEIRAPGGLGIALLFRCLCHSLGSVAHGALFATTTRLFWLLCRKIGKITHAYRRRHGEGVTVRFVRFFLQLGESLYAKWGKFSFRQVMIFGYGFTHASALTYTQFLEKGVDTLLSDMVVEGFVFLLGLSLAAVAAIVVILALPLDAPAAASTLPYNIVTPSMGAVMTVFVVLSVAMSISIVLDIISTSVVAIFVAFTECPAGLVKYDRTMAAHLHTRLEFENAGEREERVEP